MAELQGLVWNCAALNSTGPSSSKALFFEKTFRTNFDMAFFVETHHKNYKDIPLELLRYQNTHRIFHSSAPENEPFSGIIGLISHNYKILNTEECIQGRMINIKIEHRTSSDKYNITSVYLDTNNKLTTSKATNFVNHLSQTLDQNYKNII